jgi:fructokinase
VTYGVNGCYLRMGEESVTARGPAVRGEAVGAGDAFSAALLHGIDREWTTHEIARSANHAGAVFVARQNSTR